ncbi:MAG: bifunctional phosphopantothenoylcysteine decarboxylase/phosphopantothenate--cysteine ligase CoaBC [Myxococcales bacterium]|nr:bifunctional phosphopantothenoylcysteine decarboxylase/phosphopantothenate--cysteine ligase CoaBC [Myxococcales bacterium]
MAGAEVVVAVGGGIAAYKAADLVRRLTKVDARVQVVMTRKATEFVGPLTFQALTGRKVFSDLFDLGQESEIGHIQIADRADLVIVAPATANLIARMAAGMADDAVTAMLLATRAPVLVAPSMNVNMWDHPLTQQNLARLVGIGTHVVEPGVGFLACKWIGKGRLAEPADIVEAAAHVLAPHDLRGRRVVVSAGPTFEPIDPVRFLGNRSSGKMGFAVAAAAARRGADVTLIAGPVALDDPHGVAVTRVETAAQLGAAVDAAADAADVVIMAAAVGDFRAAAAADHKLKRSELTRPLAIELEPNPDVLAGLGARRRDRGHGPVLVGFAAETRDVVGYARAKLAAKGCDLVVGNDVSQPDAGFAVDTNRVVLVDADGAIELPLADKAVVAHGILDRVVALLAARPARAT